MAGARRIGHGVALPYERDALALAADMARKGILVEVNLSSNDIILNVRGEEHPWWWLKAAGVPFALSTDDPGISRSTLGMEYARGAADGMTYEDLKRSARNALQFSFLPGEPLWNDAPAYGSMHVACRNTFGPDCKALLARSEKAQAQWDLEQRLKAFEAGWPG